MLEQGKPLLDGLPEVPCGWPEPTRMPDGRIEWCGFVFNDEDEARGCARMLIEVTCKS